MKNMKKNFPTKVKRVIAVITTLLLIIALNMGSSKAGAGNYLAYNLIDKSNTLNTSYTPQNHFGGTAYSSPAFDFHIFAEKVTLGGHTNGNIATNQLYANTHTFGAKQNNHLGKREDNYIGQYAEALSNISSNGYIVLGRTVKTNLSKQEGRISIGRNSNIFDQQTSAKIYQETNSSSPYINVAAELSNLRKISTTLSRIKTSEDVTLSKVSGEHQTITVSGSGKNHYLNVTAAEISAGNQKRILNITMPASTTLIINVDMKGANIHSLANLVPCLNGYSNGEQVISDACGLMWNLYDSSNTNHQFVTCDYACVGCSDYFFGTILAPSAQIRYGAVNGSIIAKKTYQDGKESHRFDFTGYTEPEPPTEEPTSEKPTTEKPTTEKPTTETPTTEKPTTETPTTEKPTTEKPTTEKPTTETPTTEKPTTEKPTTEEPTTEQPTTQPVSPNTIVPNTPVNISIHAQKILKDHTLSDKQFTFRIVDANNNTIATTQNDASGNISFDPITFETAGFYLYYIVEVNDEQTNIHYDDSCYPVIIQVTRYGNGTMTIQAEYVENPVFTNLYVKQKAVTTTQQATTASAQPAATSAKTGDETNPAIYMVGFITSIGLLTSLYIYIVTSKNKSDK